MTRVVLPLLVLAIACPAASATPAPVAQVARGLAGQVRRTGFSGVVLVARHGRIALARGYGMRNRSAKAPNTIDTAFNLASIGKMFTGVAVAQLVAAGKVRYTDPVGRFLPQLPAALRALTVAQLLDHTSGLGDYFSDPGFERLRPRLVRLSDYLPLIETERPLYRPGTRWSYSNSGFLLAGLVVEHASGEAYAVYLRRHVWGPAGMTRTGCFDRLHLPAFAAVGYVPGGGTNTATLAPRGTSAGGCYSTARDMLAFANALVDHRLLDAKNTALITTQKVAAPGGGYGYGFGIRRVGGQPPTIWHNGGAPGAAGEIDINPRLGTTVITLANVGPPSVFPIVDFVLNTLRVP